MTLDNQWKINMKLIFHPGTSGSRYRGAGFWQICHLQTRVSDLIYLIWPFHTTILCTWTHYIQERYSVQCKRWEICILFVTLVKMISTRYRKRCKKHFRLWEYGMHPNSQIASVFPSLASFHCVSGCMKRCKGTMRRGRKRGNVFALLILIKGTQVITAWAAAFSRCSFIAR